MYRHRMHRASCVVWICLAAVGCGGPPDRTPGAGAEELAPAEPPSFAQETEALSSSCAGVMPGPLGPGLTESEAASPGDVCVNGTSDASGHLAIGKLFHYTHFVSWHVVGLDGTPGGYFSARRMGALLPQWSGFHGLSVSPSSRVFLNTYSTNGVQLRMNEIKPGGQGSYDAAVDYDYGSFAVVSRMTSPGTWQVTAQRYDEEGDPVFGSPVVVRPGSGPNAPFIAVAGVDLHGRLLVLWDGSVDGAGSGTLRGRWLRHDGSFIGAPFLAASGLSEGTGYTLYPLIGGGLALLADNFSTGRQWLARYRPHIGGPLPPPAWLAARPNVIPRLIRDNHAYALVPVAYQTVPDCKQELELRAPSGRLCGTLTFPLAAGACETRGIDVGRDGTVIQQSVLPDDCQHTWWPQLLE